MFGLFARNEDNIIQIDSTYSNYEVVSSGRNTQRDGIISFAEGGILFFRPVTNGNHVGRGRMSDVNNSFRYLSGADASWTWESNPQAPGWAGIDYVVVRPSSGLSEGQGLFGLKVNDAQGLAAFDSRRDYLKITGVHRVGPTGGTIDISLPTPSPGKRHYLCALPFYFTSAVRTQYGDEEYFGYSAGFTNNTTLRIRRRQTVYAWQGTSNTTSARWSIGDDHLPFFIVAEF